MGGDNRSSAVADTLPRLIKMSELHERLGVSKRQREKESEREMEQKDNKLQKLQTKQRSKRSSQTIRALLSMNSCRIRNQLLQLVHWHA